LSTVNDAGVPAVRVPEVNVTVSTLDAKVAVAAGVLVMPPKEPTVRVFTFGVGLNPVSVITTLEKAKTDRGVKVTITLVGAPIVLTAATAGVTEIDIPII